MLRNNNIPEQLHLQSMPEHLREQENQVSKPVEVRRMKQARRNPTPQKVQPEKVGVFKKNIK